MPRWSKSPSRRTVVCGGAAAALTACATAPNSPSATKPNILFIVADDLGYADVSCYGRRDYETPHVDRLAADGVRFVQGYANSAVCSATRTALITGRYQNRLPIGLEEPLVNRDVGLPPEHPTLPSLLRRAGYGATLIGKWHLGQLPKYGPLLSGYDHFWGFRGGSVDYFTHASRGRRRDLWDGDVETEAQGYLTDLLGDRAVQAIEGYAASGRPFFISLHFSAPHWPWEGVGDRAESERLAQMQNPQALFHHDGGSQRTYADMVLRMDMQIGRALDALDRLRLADNTIVVFTSDNGGERFSDTWPFSGRKTELLEGGIRVPAIVRWPGVAPRGRAHDQVMISMDWHPTLLEAAGATPHPDYPTDGMDLVAAIGGAAPQSRTLCWRYLHNNQEACRDGDWKYLKIGDNTFLFNVVDDPLERANMKLRRPEIFDAIVARYRAWDGEMLPLDANANTGGFSGRDLADRFGVED